MEQTSSQSPYQTKARRLREARPRAERKALPSSSDLQMLRSLQTQGLQTKSRRQAAAHDN